MYRCLIVLDLDSKSLEASHPNNSWVRGYAEIRDVFKKHRFNNIQGTVYLGDDGVRQAHGTVALQEIATRFSWFDKCVLNVHVYDLVDSFNGQFIIDEIAQARLASGRRIDELRQQLISAALPLDKVDEIIGKQVFFLENATHCNPFPAIGGQP